MGKAIVTQSAHAPQARCRDRMLTAPPAQPQRRVRGLDRAVEDSSQIAVERVEVDLLAEPRAEGLEHARAAAAVEAPIDRALDPAAGEAEERGDSERRAGEPGWSPP